MKVYLAGRYGRRVELLAYANELRTMGIEVTSRWLNGEHEKSDSNLANIAVFSAREDMVDVINADVIVSFTEQPRSSCSRGGRHVEFGIGLALHKRQIIVGPRENVFHFLPEIEQDDTWSEARAALIGRLA